MTEPVEPDELEATLMGVYRGPLEEFIARRDTLAKQLRAAKRRDDADRVKALRKPSRTAWVLDSVVHEDPGVIEQLVEAISSAQTVQSGADLRAAVETIRTAVRAVAAVGARTAIRAGQPVEANTLAMALHAVIGETKAFDDLRAGRLVDVPDGGGLDILAALPAMAPPPPRQSPKTSTHQQEPDTAPNAPPKARRATEPDAASAAREAAREAEVIAAGENLRRAEAALAEARQESTRVGQLVLDAQAQLKTAERALTRAEAEARERLADVERVRRDADAVTKRVVDAERAVAEARTRSARLSG